MENVSAPDVSSSSFEEPIAPEKIEAIKNKIAAFGPFDGDAQGREKDEFYIFYSFDLVNSTQFKTRFPQIWPILTRTFFDQAQRAMESQFAHLSPDVNAKLWKFAGDEVLFYQKVTKAEDCDHAAPIARQVLDILIEIVHEKEDARALLSVKGTVWCARTIRFLSGANGEGYKFKECEGECRNLAIKDENGNYDFLGPEVDAGFRIAKYSTHRRLVLSADLAYLYYFRRRDMGKIRDKYDLKRLPTDLMKIVGLEKLKGVWDERSYPVIWFENDWKDIKKSFYYDDGIESDFLKSVAKRSNKFESISFLEQIYADRGQLHRMQDFAIAIEQIQDPNEEASQRKIRRAELHCVPVCVRADGRILVAKRAEHKMVRPNHWSFGCGQLDHGQSVGECLIQTCIEDFGIHVLDSYKFIALDEFSFTIEDEDHEKRKVPGVIFAVYCGDASDEPGRKYKETYWVDPNNVFDGIDGQFVPDFAETIALASRRAREMWNVPGGPDLV